MQLKIIARIHTGFKEKFGIPRQSGIADGAVGKIVFEDEYKLREALRGIEGYSHLWLIWGFSEAVREEWSPTVRPPRLGGNKRMGVFATRSPYRPNSLGLSSVRLLEVVDTEDGAELIVSGVDMLDGTPIYDIKPYLKFTDSHEDAVGGFSDVVLSYKLEVDFPQELLSVLDSEVRSTVIELLEGDPRPAYHTDEERVYGMIYADFEIFFKVKENRLSVVDVVKKI